MILIKTLATDTMTVVASKRGQLLTISNCKCSGAGSVISRGIPGFEIFTLLFYSNHVRPTGIVFGSLLRTN